MRLWYKISIPVLAITAAMFLIIFLSFNFLQGAFLQEEVSKLEEAVIKSQQAHLPRDFFLNPFNPIAQEHFGAFAEPLHNSATARFSVWGRNHTIIFSDLTSVIGYHSPNHAEVARLFKNGVSFFISKNKDNNEPMQSNIGEFLDVYIPLRADGEILGAVEMHIVQESALKPFAKQAWNVFWTLIFGSVISVAMIFILEYRFILRPIYALRKATKAISKGDFNYQVAVHSKDEIGDLASDFELMKYRLKEDSIRRAKIEAEITQRSLELERMNRLMIGRELKMVALKKEIAELKAKKS